MGKLAIEVMLIFIVCFGVFAAIWKLILSKIPAVRVLLKLQAIEETEELAKAADSVDIGEARKKKKIVEKFTKEDI